MANRAMLISCPNCGTSYDVSAASLGAEGRQVRCVRCQDVWFASPAETPSPGGDAQASAAAASAQYQRGAAGTAQEPPADAPEDEFAAADDEMSVDPNLAARAADRSRAAFDDPPAIEDDAPAAVADEDALAEHAAPPLAPDGEEPTGVTLEASAAREAGGDIESSAARRAQRDMAKRTRRPRQPRLATVIVVLFAVNAALVGWRSDVVRLMPQTASLFAAIGLPVNLRGVAFADVTTSTETHDGVTVLLVQGTIANISRQMRDVPRIRIAMRNAAGGEVYAWTALPERAVLAAGEAERFQTRLAAPPAEGQAVAVRFFNRRDLVGGGR